MAYPSRLQSQKWRETSQRAAGERVPTEPVDWASVEAELEVVRRTRANLLIIGHRTPLEMVTRQQFPDTVLPEGAMAVFAPTGSEGRLFGALKAEELIAVSFVR